MKKHLYEFISTDPKGKQKHQFKQCLKPEQTKIYKKLLQDLNKDSIKTFTYKRY